MHDELEKILLEGGRSHIPNFDKLRTEDQWKAVAFLLLQEGSKGLLPKSRGGRPAERLPYDLLDLWISYRTWVAATPKKGNYKRGKSRINDIRMGFKEHAKLGALTDDYISDPERSMRLPCATVMPDLLTPFATTSVPTGNEFSATCFGYMLTRHLAAHAYCAMPSPNDQFSFGTSRRLTKMFSGLMPGFLESRDAGEQRFLLVEVACVVDGDLNDHEIIVSGDPKIVFAIIKIACHTPR